MEDDMELVLKFDSAMTVWIDGKPINTDGNERLNIVGIEDVLPSIVDQLFEEYIDTFEVGVRGDALSIAARAFAVDSIDKVTAECMAQDMALLAADLLREAEIDWDHATLAALKKILHSNPDIEQLCTPTAA
jgi:hypothetical protein